MLELCTSMSNININDVIVTPKLIQKICPRLPEGCWKYIGEKLGIDSRTLENIDRNVNNYDDNEKLCKLVHKYPEIHQSPLKYSELVPYLPESCTEQFRQTISSQEQSEEIVLDAALCEIQCMLKIVYHNLQLPDVSAWCKKKELYLSDLYVDLILYTKNNEGIDVANGQVKLEDMFKPIGKSSQATRILIEGQPGYGKTTLGHKLLLDWARGEEYISQFQLVFNIPLRDFDGDIEATLIESCDVDKLTDEHKRQIIENYTEEILVILDGLDEIDDEKKNALVSLLNGKLFSNMTIVVTSRTGLFYPEQESQAKKRKVCLVKKLKNQNQLKGNFYQKKIEVAGLLPQSQVLLLKKYFPGERNNFETKLLSYDEVISDLCQCPLYLFLIAVLMEDDILVNIKTKTDLYEKIFAFIIKRALDKEYPIEDTEEVNDEDVDLFSGQTMELLSNFGEFALENLRKDQLCFDQKEIVQKCNQFILKVGFLFKHVSFQKHQRQESYQPVHKSFLEFAAAYYLWTRLKDVPEAEINNYDTIIKLVESGFGPTEESIVYPFLAGLLHENAKMLFLALRSYGVFYPVNGYVIPDVLTEVNIIDGIFNSLLQFVPCVWENHNYPDFFNTSRHADILERAFQAKRIKLLGWNLHFACKFPPKVVVDTLHIIVNSEISNGVLTASKTSITCNHLIISVNRMKRKTWKLLLAVLSFIQTKKLTIRHRDFFSRKKMLTSLWVSFLKPDGKSKVPMLKIVTKLHKLIVCQLVEHTDYKLLTHIQQLVCKGGIEYGLSLRISNTRTPPNVNTTNVKAEENVEVPIEIEVESEDKDPKIRVEHVNDFIKTIAKSNLKEFCLVIDKNCSFKPTVDLGNFSTHQWNKLVFKGNIHVTCSLPPMVTSLCLAIYQNTSDEQVSEVTKPNLNKSSASLKQLECSNAALISLLDSKMYSNITDVKLNYCPKLVSKNDMNCLNRFTNLNSLVLNFCCLKFTVIGNYFEKLLSYVRRKSFDLTIQISENSFQLGSLFLGKLLVSAIPVNDVFLSDLDELIGLDKKPPKCLLVEFDNFPPTEHEDKMNDFFVTLKGFLTENRFQTLKLHAPEDWNVNGWTNWIMSTFPCTEGFEITDDVKFYGDEMEILSLNPSTFSRVICIKLKTKNNKERKQEKEVQTTEDEQK